MGGFEPAGQFYPLRKVNGKTGQSIVVTAADMPGVTRAAAAATTPLSIILSIQTVGFAMPGDGGGALYTRVGSDPANGAGFQTADGQWWDLAETVVTPQMFGAKGDGVTDDTAALSLWFSYGGELFAPNGDYRIAGTGPDSGGVAVTLLKATNIRCAPRARFFSDGVDNDTIRFTVPDGGVGLPAHKFAFRWTGGIIDISGSKQSTVVPFPTEYPAPTGKQGTSATCDALSIRTNYLGTNGPEHACSLIHLSGIEVYAGEHWEVAGGDSAMFLNCGADLTLVEGCVFHGTRDVALYLSFSDYTTQGYGPFGGRVVSRNHKFTSCFFGEKTSRSQKGFETYGHEFNNCVTAQFLNYILGDGGSAGFIGRSRYYGCTTVLRADYCNGIIADFGTAENCGAMRADGVTRVIAYDRVALAISGATGCAFHGLRIVSVSAAYQAVGYQLMSVGRYDHPTLGAIPTTYCDFDDNLSLPGAGSTSAGGEVTGEANYNRLRGNYVHGAAAASPAVSGANSTNIRRGPGGQPIHMTPVLFEDGTLTVPIIGRRSGPGTGIRFDSSLIALASGGADMINVTPDGLMVNHYVQGGLGTAAAPTFSFSSDADTGIFRSASNRLGVALGGVQVVDFAATVLAPVTDAAVDFGAVATRWKDAYFSGVIYQAGASLASTYVAKTTARADLLLTGRQTSGDADYPIAGLSTSSRVVELSAALTATRTWTLPAASSFAAGERLTLIMGTGSATSANTLANFPLVIAPNGTDNINGVNASISTRQSNAVIELWSNGTTGWVTDPRYAGGDLTYIAGTNNSVTITPKTRRTYVQQSTPLTVNRIASITPGYPAGWIVRVTRSAASTGAFTYTVQDAVTIANTKALSVSQWVDFISDGTSWSLSASGAV